MPRRKVAKASPPVVSAPGLSVKSLAKSKRAAGSRGLKNGELDEAQFHAEFHRMAAVYLGQVFRNLVGILFLDGWQETRTADTGGAIVNRNARQAAILGAEGNTGKSQLRSNVLVIVQLKAMGVDTVITEIATR